VQGVAGRRNPIDVRVEIDDEVWAEVGRLREHSPARAQAEKARREIEAHPTTVPWQPCEEDGPRGTRLADCVSKRLIHVRHSYVMRHEDAPKSGRVRSVPMIDQVATALDALSRRKAWTGDEDLVFVNPAGEHIEDSALRRRFYAALEAAGLKHIRFHDLRHSFGTLAVQVFPLSDVKAYMGHADIATTMIYVHHVPQVDAAEKLSAALRETTTTASVSAVTT
jgi:Phage integrase family